MPVDCDQCGMTVPNFECLVQHCINVHQEDRISLAHVGKCPVCVSSNPKNIMKLKRYRNQEELDAHAATHNTVVRKIKCRFCDDRFVFYADLSKHYATVHNNSQSAEYAGQCDFCSMMGNTTKYPTYESLKQHWFDFHVNGANSHMSDEAIQLLKEDKFKMSRQ